MKKEEYIKLFTDAIEKSDISLVEDIRNTECIIEDDSIYFDFEYQIDDRIDRMDDEVESNIRKIIGDEYGVSVNRKDAFPNGYAVYKITIAS